MATFNGERFVERQINSLKDNHTPFTLHWLDDHSTDATRDVVRNATQRAGIPLKEWRSPHREGVPSSFFCLLERVDADIYLFCDQDDIWQPSKIDATVQHLIPQLSTPSICFSDPLIFRGDAPVYCYHTLDVMRTTTDVALRESRAFTSVVGYGHTQGFTRKLRDIFLSHAHIARTHAFMHDMWMYEIALATGTVCMLSDVPTTLFRRHGANASVNGWIGSGRGYLDATWEQFRRIRRLFSRNARGFLLVAETLPPSRRLERLCETARLVSTLDRRHSLLSIIRIARHGILYPNMRLAMKLALSCLLSNAIIAESPV